MKLWKLFNFLAGVASRVHEKMVEWEEKSWTATCVRCGKVVRYSDNLGLWNAPNEGWVCSNCYRENEP